MAPVSAPIMAPVSAPFSAPVSAPTTAAPTFGPCNEEYSKMCITDIKGAAFASMGRTRLCPANCPGDDCINWGFDYVQFKNMVKSSMNNVSGDVLKVVPESMMKNYVSLYSMTSVVDGPNEGEKGEINCWLNCMGTSKCVGYKWDTSAAQCTMYSKMTVEMVPKGGSDVIKWMCGDTAIAGTICSFDDLVRGKGSYASGPTGGYSFQPDPGCSVFNCDGITISTLAM